MLQLSSFHYYPFFSFYLSLLITWQFKSFGSNNTTSYSSKTIFNTVSYPSFVYQLALNHLLMFLKSSHCPLALFYVIIILKHVQVPLRYKITKKSSLEMYVFITWSFTVQLLKFIDITAGCHI